MATAAASAATRESSAPTSSSDEARRRRAEAPTIPPPAPHAEGTATKRSSGIRPKRRGRQPNAATVDEVVADLSRDPRREDEDGDDD